MKSIGNLVGAVVPSNALATGTALAPTMPVAVAADVLARPLSPIAYAALKAVDGPLVRVEQADPKWPNASPQVAFRAPTLPADAGRALPEIRRRADAMRSMLAPAGYDVVGPWVMQLAARTHFRSREAEAQAEIAMTTKALCEPGAGIPAACFTDETLWLVIDAATEEGRRWFPPASVIRDALRPMVRPAQDDLSRLNQATRAIEGTSSDDGTDAPLTDAEVAQRIAGYVARPDRFALAASRVLRSHLERTDPDMLARHAAALDSIGHTGDDVPARPDRPVSKPSPYSPMAHAAYLEGLVDTGVATEATKTRLAALRRQYGEDA